jgi:hypothetical protein
VFTLLLYALLALVAVACLYGLATLFLSRTEQIAPATADRSPWRLRDQALEPNDIVDLRLPVALRGYRFAETDLLLDRLTEELRERDEEIARLRGAGGSAAAPPLSMTTRPDAVRPAEPALPSEPALPTEPAAPANAD